MISADNAKGEEEMIISEMKDQVGYISLDNSSRLNALSAQMDDEIIACLKEFEAKKFGQLS